MAMCRSARARTSCKHAVFVDRQQAITINQGDMNPFARGIGNANTVNAVTVNIVVAIPNPDAILASYIALIDAKPAGEVAYNHIAPIDRGRLAHGCWAKPNRDCFSCLPIGADNGA